MTATSTARAHVHARAPGATRAARTSVLGAAAFLALLALLHVLDAELDPSWHVISEYALGRHGWLMTLAFASLALSCGALAVAAWPRARGKVGRLGHGVLAVCAVGLALAAAFPTDPITTPPESATTSGQLHMLGATLGGLVPFAAPLVTWSLTRTIASSRERLLLWGAVAIVWIGELVFVGAMTLASDDGRLGPGVLVGWPNRLMIVSYCAWLLAVASRLGAPARSE
jgi:hypothetical protein